jgi:hypothetical protein
MEPPRDDQLIADLQALRPTPRPQFAAELDDRAAAGFPRRSRLPLNGLPTVELRPLLMPAAGFAMLAIAVVTAVLTIGHGSGNSKDRVAAGPSPVRADREGHVHQFYPFDEERAAPSAGSASAPESTATVESEGETLSSAVAPANRSYNAGFNGTIHHRAVERSAEITLAAEPKDVNDDASRVFEAVHANNGIVMRSSTQEGRPGEAGATFDLLVPSARLADAMAAFSEIDAVRSRREATADITAPTVTAAALLKGSRARIDSLLSQLGAAETEEEQEAIEAELRHERRHASRLAAQLSHLHKRADFSRVSLQIETGSKGPSGSGAWGIGDALHDAGHVLTVAAAVLLIALAVLGPIALIALLARLTHRAWVRRERRRVLSS